MQLKLLANEPIDFLKSIHNGGIILLELNDVNFNYTFAVLYLFEHFLRSASPSE